MARDTPAPTTEDDSILRSKARALAASVWAERHHAMRFEALSPDASDLLVDCCLKGMAVGIIGGSDLARRVPAPLPELIEAEAFIAGFEDDETQEGISGPGGLLARIRATIAKATGQ